MSRLIYFSAVAQRGRESVILQITTACFRLKCVVLCLLERFQKVLYCQRTPEYVPDWIDIGIGKVRLAFLYTEKSVGTQVFLQDLQFDILRHLHTNQDFGYYVIVR